MQPTTKINYALLLVHSLSPLYIVMQSDGNSFCGDVVLDSSSMACRNEDSNVEQNYEKQILGNIAQNNKKIIGLRFSSTVVLVCIFVKCYKRIKIIIILIHEHIFFYIWGLKCYLHPELHCYSCQRWHHHKNCSHVIASHCTVSLAFSLLWSLYTFNCV